ncbi:murein hydrolase activator EnvC family protein [Marinicella litoralis]|uniref:Septal ring factor EnvC (AmiA/AmiB activator) n=1 Tax=Marinicella litoralis TaxID=644220 RepID=A0A4R6XZX0_9GAMM|nr:peptidoglycan DD-metalloendopeptidase family protein [Marinicella litoralis]TDR23877.1 septal ring factor EnvC (AmiA/AmiB activator) [Marinicella litoralis]
MDEVAINEKLNHIRLRLTDLKNALNQAEGEEAKLIKELENQDQKINQQGQLIRSINDKISTAEQQIEVLGQEIKNKNESISVQKSQMADLLRLHIFINHDRILKMMLLNPSTKNAEITQHQIKYLQFKLYDLIKSIALQIKQLVLYQGQISIQKDELVQQQQQLEQEKDVMLEQKRQRAVVLNALRNTIKTYQTENETLTKDSERLNQLLLQITQYLNDLPENLGEDVSFAKLKGSLTKPLDGTVIRSYRSLRAGYSRWDGIVIGNEAGQNVVATAYGRVAFADWLRGYGLLIVIDHGDDYMTLYGHNETLLAEVGDWVQADQVIATAGNSGNIDPSGVYFEIRKAADPTNPIPWFK